MGASKRAAEANGNGKSGRPNHLRALDVDVIDALFCYFAALPLSCNIMLAAMIKSPLLSPGLYPHRPPLAPIIDMFLLPSTA